MSTTEGAEDNAAKPEQPEDKENLLLPKVGSKRPFATKSTGSKRRKLSVAPNDENLHAEVGNVDASQQYNQAQPLVTDPYQQQYPEGQGNEMMLPAESFRQEPEWMEKDKKTDYMEPYASQPYHDPDKPVDSFPATGFPVPLPAANAGMGHPYSMNYPPPEITTGQLAGGFGASDPNLAETPAEPVQSYKWVECAFCLKWRKIPAEVNDTDIPQPWSCADNSWDECHNTCNAPQEDDGEADEAPFTQEEMNAPLPVPPQEAVAMGTGYQYSYDPSRFENSFQHGMHDPDEWEPEEEEERPNRGRRGGRGRTRSRPTNTVSLSNLLDNSEGVDPQYAKERKEFYQNLEGFLQRPPDVNLLCGAPVDLYQLFTETTGRGGYEQVCTSKQWREIFRQLPQYSQTHTSASYALKKMYRKNLLEYENAQRSGLI